LKKILFILMGQLTLIAQAQHMKISNYTSNPGLKTIVDTTIWKGNPLDEKGLFMNHEFPFWPTFSELWKWQRETNKQKDEKKKDTFQLAIVKNDTAFLSSKEDVIVWLGHATFFIRINGINIITDPVFGSPGTFLKRKVDMPFDPALIKNIHYILLSHDHRDHLDEKSIHLVHKNNPQAEILTGLKMEEWLNKMLQKPKLQTAGWYQQYKTDNTSVNIYFMPARHWSRRGLTDTNKHLWGSFVIEANGKKVFFSGDTGYGSHLKQVGDLFNGVDVCIIGVGAYKPEWFMGANHISPNDAIKAVNEMKVKTMIPMHFGTFDLSDEPIGEPQKILEKPENKALLNANLNVLTIGKAFSY
jgi:L-ascorbate metabolism protein UlaG (beta-lactamase superfamily)